MTAVNLNMNLNRKCHSNKSPWASFCAFCSSKPFFFVLLADIDNIHADADQVKLAVAVTAAFWFVGLSYVVTCNTVMANVLLTLLLLWNEQTSSCLAFRHATCSSEHYQATLNWFRRGEAGPPQRRERRRLRVKAEALIMLNAASAARSYRTEYHNKPNYGLLGNVTQELVCSRG